VLSASVRIRRWPAATLLSCAIACAVAGGAFAAPSFPGARVEQAPSAGSHTFAVDAHARWIAEFPADGLSIGAPVEVVAAVEHAANLDARLELHTINPDAGWLILELAPTRRATIDAGRVRTVFRLRVAPIATGGVVGEAGDFEPAPHLEWPPLDVVLTADVRAGGSSGSDGSSAAEIGRVVLAGVAVRVASAIPAGDLAPAPPRGFAAIEAPPSSAPAWYTWFWSSPLGIAALAALLGAVALSAVSLRRSRRRAPPPAPLPTPAERLERALVVLVSRDEAARRDGLFEVVAGLRAAADEALRTPRAGLADEEWLAALARDPRAAAIATRLGALFETSSAGRWGGEVPSVYGAEALARSVRELAPAIFDLGRERAA